MSVIVTEKDIASLTDALGREQHRTGELSAELRDLKAASVSVVQAEIMSNQAFVAGYDALAAEVLPVLEEAQSFELAWIHHRTMLGLPESEWMTATDPKKWHPTHREIYGRLTALIAKIKEGHNR